MRAAASLLSAARSTNGLADLVVESGLAERCVHLETGEQRQLGVEQLRDVRLGALVGACPVLIGAVPDDTPKDMYAALGFAPVCVLRSYTKRRAGGATTPAG